MAKTIKFNLICDDKPVRTIEDLQENFSIEDVLKYYKNGLLLRWLKVRGYEDEYKKVAEISESETIEIIKSLIKIFNVESDENKIEEGVYMLQFVEERRELCKLYEKDDFKVKSIIEDYQSGFRQLIDDIIENPDDIARIKANIAELMSNYKWAMDLSNRDLFWKLQKCSPLAIMCLLMNDEARKYYLPIPVKEEETVEVNEGEVHYDTSYDNNKRIMYNRICSMIAGSNFASKLGDNLHIFAGVTEGYWKDLEVKGKKYMILSMGIGDFVRSAGVQGGDLSSTDIKNKFLILDGIDYKSNSESRQLVYMEV